MAELEPVGTETRDWDSLSLPVSVRDLTGTTLGDFEVERLLGRGGMGEVYLARQVSLNRQVAFKVLRPDLVKNPTYIGRFDAEAWAAAKLNHPNIVHVYSIGTLEGLKYIAMEYVQGTNLKEYVTKKGPLDLALGLSIFKQATQAIGAAGELGLVHRDIKPENLLLTKKGQVKVADFGLCRDTGDANHHLTQPGVTMGTPMYMSPEQVQGHVVDHRSDLYSLGVTAYHMFTGSAPFKAETAVALALKHLKDTPISTRVHRPDLPVELDLIIIKLMEKNTSERYQSAAEVLRDLAKLRETMQTQPELKTLASTATNLPLPGLTASTGTSKPASSIFETLGNLPRPEFALSKSIIALILVLCLGGGVAFGWSKRPADLLHDTAAEPVVPPALWMASNWTSVERFDSAKLQYHHAQWKAPEDQRQAAWMAVPGYFPTAHDWGTKAYTQFARLLFRNQDAERLEQLAKELARATDRPGDQALAQIARGGVAALRHEYQGVVNELKGPNDLLDAGVVELGLEIVTHALRTAKVDSTSSVYIALQGLNTRFLINLLRIESQDYPSHTSARIQAPNSSKIENRRSSLAWRS